MSVDGPISEEQLQTFQSSQFLNSAINEGRPLLTNGRDSAAGTGEIPRIVVQQGAEIKGNSATVMLAAPEVINAGSISSDNGQVVLAGSRRDVYVAVTDSPSPSEEEESQRNQDQVVRGFLVEVDSGDAVDSNGNPSRGAVINAGEITSKLGNITLIANEIIQAGKVVTSTAVDVNGSIRILARDKAEAFKRSENLTNQGLLDGLYLDRKEAGRLLPQTEYVAAGQEAGTVTFTGDSVTEGYIQNSEGAIDTEHQPRTQVNIEGRQVTLESGAHIVAPNAELTVRARSNPIARTDDVVPADSDASFTMAADSVIDVSGTEYERLAASRNIVVFDPLTSNEVKDSPEQKDGALKGEEVAVDVRKGTSAFDWESAAGQRKKISGRTCCQRG